MSEHKCGGKCCRAFTYPRTPTELRAEPWLNWSGQRDALYIADMLIPLEKESDDEVQHYTCTHFDPEAGICTAYDERPRMCAEYPYTQACVGCGFENEPDLIALLDRRAIDEGWRLTNIVLGEN